MALKKTDPEMQRSIDLINQGNFNEAVAVLEPLEKRRPNDTQVLGALGQIYIKLKQYDKAIKVLEKVAALAPNAPKPLMYLAQAYLYKVNFPQALEKLKKAILLDPNDSKIYILIAKILILDFQELLAKIYLEEALKVDPNNPGIYMLLADCYSRSGNSEKALELSKVALDLEPNKKEHLCDYMFFAHKIERFTYEDFYNLALELNARFLSNLKPCYDHGSRYDVQKQKLKLGYVSADFRNHPAGNFIKKIFEEIDRSKFEIHLFYNHTDESPETKQFVNLADSFTKIVNQDLNELAENIYKLQIDVLFDLSGITAGQRLDLFKLKPAPLQISHTGYFGTLGIPEIDYVIVDKVILQTGEEKFFVEKPYYFPGSFTHCTLFAEIPKNENPPCLVNSFVTFGSMNTFHKISETVIKTWCEILHAVASSKLLIDSRFLISEMNKDYAKKVFEKYGIDSSRLIFKSTILRPEFIATYNEIDIALDTFPYTGSSTTVEALCMGVPVVTIEGHSWVQRMSASILDTIAHPELIAKNCDEYKSIIIELANDFKRIDSYRKNLRIAVKESSMNIDRFVKDYEKAIFDMWQEKSLEYQN